MRKMRNNKCPAPNATKITQLTTTARNKQKNLKLCLQNTPGDSPQQTKYKILRISSDVMSMFISQTASPG